VENPLAHTDPSAQQLLQVYKAASNHLMSVTKRRKKILFLEINL
jgi:hypothetical protein